MTSFKPKRSLHQQVVTELGLRIVKGVIKAGDTFPSETDLSVELGVSRTVTREAIKVLSQKGMIVSRPKTGTQVQARTNWNLLDADVLHWEFSVGGQDSFYERLTEVRLIIEPAASALAARRATPEEVLTMENSFREMVANVDDNAAYIVADMHFHTAIVAASHNDLLEQIVVVIRSALLESRTLTTRVPGANRAAIGMHGAVLDAIRERRPADANSAMCRLIEQAGNDLQQAIEFAGDTQAS